MTSPIPALKPTSTGSEMKLATNPNRSSEAKTKVAPTNRVSVAEVLIREAGSLATNCSNSVADKIASVVVVLTLSGRDKRCVEANLYW
jgi:hypothetical protein